MLADELEHVVGVGTDRDEHVVAVVTVPAGAVVAGAAAAREWARYRGLLRVAERHAPGRRAWAIEGSGSYGAGLGDESRCDPGRMRVSTFPLTKGGSERFAVDWAW